MQINEQIVTIKKAIYGGLGIGYHDGKAILTHLAIPDETVRVRFIEEKKDYVVSEIIEVIEPSANRIIPECKNFGICGGCSYLNIRYDYELQVKKEIIIDSLRRITGIPQSSIPTIASISNQRYHYRSHADIKFNKTKPGFFKRLSNHTIPFDTEGCLLLAPEINNALFSMQKEKGQCKVAIDHTKNVHVQGDNSAIQEYENGLFFGRDIQSFFQINTFLRSSMQKIAYEMADLTTGKTFFDVGCGVGFLSLYIAKKSFNGWGCDINTQSIDYAIHNAAINGIESVRFIPSPVERINPLKYKSDVVLLDPPRAGLSKRAINRVLAFEPARIVYVSCNPSTFARDIKYFIHSGFNLINLSMIDMFPGTHHIELISALQKMTL